MVKNMKIMKTMKNMKIICNATIDSIANIKCTILSKFPASSPHT